MAIYIFMVFWIIVVCAFAKYSRRLSMLTGEFKWKISRGAAFISMGIIVFFIGLRSEGADTGAYIKLFQLLQTGYHEVKNIIQTRNPEFGFTLFGTLVKTYISENYHVYLFIIALVSGVCTVNTLWKYSDYFTDSMILFMLSGTFTWMINGIRQYIVISIAFNCVHLIVKKKMISYVIVIILLSTIHTSALVLLPVYFVVQGDAWNKKTLFVLFGCVLVIFMTVRFTEALSSILENTIYDGSTAQFASDDGSNPIRTMVIAVPVILAFFSRHEIRNKATQTLNVFINMSILALGVSCVSMVTSGILMGRLISYFTIYNLVLLPWLVHETTGKYYKTWYISMIMFYCVYFYYECFTVNYYYYASDILNLYIY